MRDVPRFIQPAFYRAVHNAWNTKSTFGEGDINCRWCGIRDGDHLNHYLVCPVMLGAMGRMRPMLLGMWCCRSHPPLTARLLPAALCISVQSDAWAKLIVIWHVFLHHCYALAKFGRFTGHEWELAFRARRRVWHRFAPTTSQLLEQFLNRF